MRRLGAALRAHRAGSRLTQQQLADLAGVSVRTIRYIEQGDVQRPRAASIRQLEAVLSRADKPEPSGGLRIGVLGPFIVDRAGAAVALTSTQQRCLLALLALHANQVVPYTEVVDVLWDGGPPATYRDLLHGLVSRLRRSLRDAGAIVRQDSGYLLRIAPSQLDLLRFNDLVERDPLAAVSCWRGPILEGMPQQLRNHPTAIAAQQRRLSAALAMDLGEDQKAQLEVLVHEEPLHEALHARLMLALAAGGHQAAALTLFTLIQQRLSRELAVEPGAELRNAHVKILRGDIPAPPRPHHPIPAQLPADIAGFTGRTIDLARLDSLLEKRITVISAVDGVAGMGKTALAVHWGHRVTHRFPDGQLFADVHGHDPGQVLGRFLRALGVDPHRIPDDTDERASLYRSALAGKRVLIVLDNAETEQQVRPLVPGLSSCLVLVTSRSRLGGLVAVEGAHQTTLDVLGPAEAIELIEHVLGRSRVAAERSAAAELARLCGYLPLALRIAAGKLRLHPNKSIADAVTELSGSHRLQALEFNGDRRAGVRAAFDLSYVALPKAARLLLRRLGIIPGPDFTAAAAASLIGRDVAAALDQLVTTNLVESYAAGRYRLHDLVRLYAKERYRAEDAATVDCPLTGLHAWYLRGARAAARLLYDYFQYLDDEVAPAEVFAGKQAAWAWLDAEHVNIAAAVHEAAEFEAPAMPWLLADATSGFFMQRTSSPDDWEMCTQAGLRSAFASGDERAQAAMLLSAGMAYADTGDPRQLVIYSERALRLARRTHWEVVESRALTMLGFGQLALGNARAAHEAMDQAFPITSTPTGLAHNLVIRGLAHGQDGDLAQLLNCLAEGLRLAEESGSKIVMAQAQHAIGCAYSMLGRVHDAELSYAASLATARDHGAHRDEARNLAAIGELICARGDWTAAKVLVQQAIEISRKVRNVACEADVLAIAGRVARKADDFDTAIEQHTRSHALAVKVGFRYGEADTLIGLARTFLHTGGYADAMSYVDAALALAQPAGYRLLAGQALTTAAEAALRQGNSVAARAHAWQALELHRSTGHLPGEQRTAALLKQI
ncbi:NB-ARC domain-containing protein [Kibdelosporangium philippinense]|uniref:NB-ARC domain-containing protein n=1 Tax=Kibdelosporangium philippinense TaxID=211113 RepID=A0ABS8ZQC8_9PSEU|nr:BTAD domain-containing putative transcriptional regulator [Kibdelosporangium philippinense]MCE7009929.1 NB-ARC domain-containing protein [Kibdelosporangium philippinense]